MLNSKDFAKELLKLTRFFAGVPDSVLKHLCAELEGILPEKNFITASNEGTAIALAAGYTLATGLPGAVYMQNSGLGNAINPLNSLNDASVYSIPVLLIIGWRGEPGTQDEPQHKKQGAVTTRLLDACQIPYKILPNDIEGAISALNWAKDTMEATLMPVALLVRNNSFEKAEISRANLYTYQRESAIEDVVSCLSNNHRVFSTTGMISRELCEIRNRRGESSETDLIIPGSMGHASQIALGFSLNRPDQSVVCLDGDGACIMHMGSMVTIGRLRPSNLLHIMFNNAAHDSVGGHPSGAEKINWADIALACGYEIAKSTNNSEDTKKSLHKFIEANKCCFLEIKVAKGARHNLGRPGKKTLEMKTEFMNYNNR